MRDAHIPPLPPPLPVFLCRRIQIGLGRSGNPNSPIPGKPEIGAPVVSSPSPDEGRAGHRSPEGPTDPGISRRRGIPKRVDRKSAGSPASRTRCLRLAPCAPGGPAFISRRSCPTVRVGLGRHGLSRRAGVYVWHPDAATAPRPARRDDRETPLWLGRDECSNGGGLGRK